MINFLCVRIQSVQCVVCINHSEIACACMRINFVCADLECAVRGVYKPFCVIYMRLCVRACIILCVCGSRVCSVWCA